MNKIKELTEYLRAFIGKAQDDGWEICGDVLLKNKDGWCGSTFFHIPMKRKVKQ